MLYATRIVHMKEGIEINAEVYFTIFKSSVTLYLVNTDRKKLVNAARVS